MDEASGDAADSHGSNTFTNNNTVPSGTGKLNTAFDLESTSSHYFSHTDNSDLSTGNIDFTLQAWVNPESLAGTMFIIGKWQVSGELEYALYYNSGNSRFEFTVSANGSSNPTAATANNFGAPSTGTYVLVHAWHDATNDQLGIAVNAGTANTVAYSSGVRDGTSDVNFGRNQSVPGQFWDGLLDEIGFWKRVLTAQERTDLYNGGAGLSYENFGPAVVSYPVGKRYQGWAYAA